MCEYGPPSKPIGKVDLCVLNTVAHRVPPQAVHLMVMMYVEKVRLVMEVCKGFHL